MSDEILRPRQVCELLHIQTTYLSNARSSGIGRVATIPWTKENKRVLYRRADVLAYMAKYPKDYPEIQA